MAEYYDPGFGEVVSELADDFYDRMAGKRAGRPPLPAYHQLFATYGEANVWRSLTEAFRLWAIQRINADSPWVVALRPELPTEEGQPQVELTTGRRQFDVDDVHRPIESLLEACGAMAKALRAGLDDQAQQWEGPGRFICSLPQLWVRREAYMIDVFARLHAGKFSGEWTDVTEVA